MRFLLFSLFFLPGWLFAQATFDSLNLVHSEIVYFDFGKAALRPEADSTLQLIVSHLNIDPNIRIYLTAHTDAIGNEANNQALSERRAEAVRSALLALGVPASLLLIETFGERIPVAANDDDAGRQLNRRVTIDLYQARRMRYLNGKILDKVSGKGIRADVVLHGKSFRDSLTTDSTGNFRHPVPDNEVIAADAFAADHFFETKMLKVQEGVALELELPPAKEGAVADIKNLYFVGNQAVLLPRSEPELPKVLRFMQINPEMRIEIAGHINQPNQPPVAQDSWEWQLSVARAKLVYDYLLEQGVDSSRISYEGYGNTQMRYPSARSEREQSLNRRVEIRVLKDN